MFVLYAERGMVVYKCITAHSMEHLKWANDSEYNGFALIRNDFTPESNVLNVMFAGNGQFNVESKR